SRFLAVLGYSGSGKSSLMFSGLLPVLYGGFVTRTGPEWHVMSVRPGTTPILNIAEAAVDYMISNVSLHAEVRSFHIVIANSVCRSNHNGLTELARMIQ